MVLWLSLLVALLLGVLAYVFVSAVEDAMQDPERDRASRHLP